MLNTIVESGNEGERLRVPEVPEGGAMCHCCDLSPQAVSVGHTKLLFLVRRVHSVHCPVQESSVDWVSLPVCCPCKSKGGQTDIINLFLSYIVEARSDSHQTHIRLLLLFSSLPLPPLCPGWTPYPCTLLLRHHYHGPAQ